MRKPCRSLADLYGTLIKFEGDGLVLAGEAFGDPASPPVLFFHGGGQSRSSWRGAARRIAEQGFYGVTFDLRGHGASDWAQDGDYLLDAYGRDIERLLYQFERRVTLVGASRGGQAALVAGSRHADRVRLIMLADVAPMMRDEGIEGIRSFFDEGKDGFASLDEAADSLARNLDQTRMPDPTRLARSMRQDGSGRWHWHWDPASGKQEFLHPPSEGQAILDAADRVTSPIVLVRAEFSQVLTDAGVAEFQRRAPQLQTVIAKGAGHMFTADRNDDFATELLDWLKRTPEALEA